ncbi:MAG: zonular occludens toxin domain-containing protein [Thermoproteota archaeon]
MLLKLLLLTRLNPFRDNLILRRIFYVEHSSIDLAFIRGVNFIVDLHDLDRKVAYKREVRLIYNVITTAYLREALNKSPIDRIENMFIADEAQLLVPRIISKAVATDTWVTTGFATRLRKRGESLVIITQSPSNIEDDIRKNAQNIFIFRLQDPRDVEVIAEMLGSVHIDEVS